MSAVFATNCTRSYKYSILAEVYFEIKDLTSKYWRNSFFVTKTGICARKQAVLAKKSC